MNIQRWITASAILCLAFSSAYAAGVLEVKVDKDADSSGLTIHPDALRADARLDEAAVPNASTGTAPTRLRPPHTTAVHTPYSSPVLDDTAPRVIRRSSNCCGTQRVVTTRSCGGTRTTSTVTTRPSCSGSTSASTCGTRSRTSAVSTGQAATRSGCSVGTRSRTSTVSTGQSDTSAYNGARTSTSSSHARTSRTRSATSSVSTGQMTKPTVMRTTPLPTKK